LGERIPNLLMRNGYQTIEQVAATPDRDLLQVPKMGQQSLAELRAAIRIAPAAGQLPDRAVTLDVDQVRELRLLLGTLATWTYDGGALDLATAAPDSSSPGPARGQAVTGPTPAVTASTPPISPSRNGGRA
jgi:hypothetical protein